ncbi:S-layer homology domain-containing protein [Paenibacillus macerans]|uniref:S-layer homology domain-containing protein n=1 Tax=Paenibacillus macerans TaxID=44252 RepID=UPI003D31B3DC
MKLRNRSGFRKEFLRLISISISICCIVALLPQMSGTASAENETTSSIFTGYLPQITEFIDESDFIHPGVGLTKEILENARTEVRAQQEPWNTYFNDMLKSSASSKTVESANQSAADPNLPANNAFNGTGIQSQFMTDGLRAYTQALLYYITGDEVYRSNTLHIIRIWSQMDPSKYVYFPDGHIHTGMALYRMVSAAEILRYTSTQDPSLVWTDQDTQDFSNNLINPITDTFNHDNNYFMNQHLYPLIGSMAGYIFTGNRERYNEAVEWFTVNQTALDQGQNGSIKQLFRWMDTNEETGEAVEEPQVQIVEMGRDQAHGTGDIINVSIISRLMSAQGSKVDPVTGTVSTASDAVTPYDFLDKRILKGTDYFARYMLGYDTPWIPAIAHSDASGNPEVLYNTISPAYRGRLSGPGANMYDLYYYYKYAEGLNMEEVAPYFSEMFHMRQPFYWDSQDAGGEYWLYIPKEAEAEGSEYLPKPVSDPDLREVEDRYTALDNNSVTMQEENTFFVRIMATEEGSKIALVGSSGTSKEIGIRIRTDGTAKLKAFNDTISLPDTKGQWRYVYYTINEYASLADLTYFTVIGNGTTVDIDKINVSAQSQLSPPVFTDGNAPLKRYGYVGSEVGFDLDFSAVDAAASDVLTYQIDNAPEGVLFDNNTGAFSWNPTQAGTYNMMIEVSDGTTVSTRDVTIVVANDRESAVNAVSATYNPGTDYVSSTLDSFEIVYDDIENVIASATDADFYEKLTDLLEAVNGLQELTPLGDDGSVAYRDLLFLPSFDPYYVTDGTYDTWIGGADLAAIFDFGPSFQVSAQSFQLQPRAAFPERGAGITVYGSNDKADWTRLTPGITTVTEQPQTLTVQEDLQDMPFRFFKFQMIETHDDLFDKSSDGVAIEELGELRIFGQRHEVVNKLSNVSIGSDQSYGGRIVIGDTAKLSFQSTEAIRNVQATIQGVTAAVYSDNNLNWTAEAVMGAGTALGPVSFKLDYQTVDGVDAMQTIFTTDGSQLILTDESDLIRDVTSITNVTDSYGRAPTDAIAIANALFDNDPNTITDYRLNGNGAGGWVEFDFKEGGHAQLSYVEILARQDGYYTRINGTVIQGSNDNVTWTTISTKAISTKDWQSLGITDNSSYRYIRIYNGNAWFGNMSEVRFHGIVDYGPTPTVVKVTGVAVTPSELTLTEGETSPLTAEVMPSDATNKSVTWSSSDEAIAEVDASGVVTAKQSGTATITVTTVDGSFMATTEVTVEAASSPSNPGTTPVTPTTNSSSTSVTPPSMTGADLTYSGGETIVKATPDVAGNVKVELTEEDVAAALANNTTGVLQLKIDSGDTSGRTDFSLPIQSIVQGEKAVQTIAIEHNGVRIAISTGGASSIFGTDSKQLSLGIQPVDQAALPEKVTEVIGNRDVYDLDLRVDGNKVPAFNNSVTVSLSYSPRSDEDPAGLVIYYIDDADQMHVVKNSRYDSDSGEMVFVPEHFSRFAIVYAPASFEDLDSASWAKDMIVSLAAKQILKGVTEESFQPGRSVTRAEFLQMLMNALSLKAESSSVAPSFQDVRAGTWSYDAIAAAYSLGIVTGKSDRLFESNDIITREEMAVMIYRAGKVAKVEYSDAGNSVPSFSDESSIAEYSKEAVSAIRAAGLITGYEDGTFGPKQASTRAETAAVIYRLISELS